MSGRSHVAMLALLLVATGAAAQDHAHGQHAQDRPVATERDGADRAHDVHAAHREHAKGVTGDGITTPIEPIPPLTDADRAAAFPTLARHMEHASPINWRVLLDHFELVDGDEGRGQAWEGKAWIGTDTDRLWLRSGGERSDGRTAGSNLELLYGHSVGPWWDLVAGLRHDFNPGPSQTWAAFGVQGMAPYRFEVSATAYVGSAGRTAANVEVEYDLLLTNRLILQPVLGAWLHGKDDPRRGIGSGLSSSEVGLRLRYEVHRQFAPYVGVVYERSHGRSADMRRDGGHPASETLLVAGVRWWF